MNKKQFLNLIVRFLRGTASQNEKKLLFNHYDSFQHLKEWNKDLLGSAQKEEDILLTRYHKFLEGEETVSLASHEKKNYTRPALVAAVSLAVIFISYFFYYHNQVRDNSMQIVRTTTGERKKVVLADSTVIWMGPESELSYPSEFDPHTRVIGFKGEAFFEVKHDEAHPFVIHSDSMNTRVLGTKFNLTTGRLGAEVTLVSGRVEIDAAQQHIVLHPKQTAVFNMAKHQLKNIAAPDADDLLARKEGRYIYKGVPFQKVLSQLSKMYDEKIMVDGDMEDLHFYGTFDESQSIDKVLAIIAISIDAKVIHQQDGQYKLVPNK